MRPSIQVGVVLLGAAFTIAPATVQAQAARISQIIEEPNPLQLYSGGSQGYLGVLVGNVDSDSANKLRLKEVRGALIRLIDHDAPAGQIGLHVNDVVLEMNGQQVESAEAFGRMMRELPPGHKISLLVSRDGRTQTISVQLADRNKMESDAEQRLPLPRSCPLLWRFGFPPSRCRP
jgi:S1-C subfamily serine protease